MRQKRYGGINMMEIGGYFELEHLEQPTLLFRFCTYKIWAELPWFYLWNCNGDSARAYLICDS